MTESPTNKLAVYEIPLKSLHVKDVQVKRVSLHTVQLAISSNLWLSLIKVTLSPCLAVKLLNLVSTHIKQITVIGLLIRSCEASKDEDVLVGYLEEAATLQAYPVCVLLNFQVKSLPLKSFLQVKLLNQVCPLASIETSYHVQELVIERYCCMEVSLRVKISYLSPGIRSYIIYFTLIH